MAASNQTPYQYYNDPQFFGSYQYVTLKEIIDGLTMRSFHNDSYLKSAARTLLQYHAKIGIKKHIWSPLRVEITVPPSGYIIMPQDYKDYVKVSVVGEDYHLKTLDINRSMNIATGYLQDHNFEILFDNDGEILTADSSNIYNKPYRKRDYASVGSQFGLNTATLSQWGEFNVDEIRGIIGFSDNLIGKEIVLEYESDGLQFEVFDETEIKVHKHFEETVKSFVIWAFLKDLRNVSQSEKTRAYKDFKTELHDAKKKRADFNLIEIGRLIRTKSMHP